MTAVDAVKSKISEEIAWLAAHPDFEERPAGIREFLGPDYLNIEDLVRPALIEVLEDIFGKEPNVEKVARYRQAIFTGGIGTGKSTLAAIALCYMVHWLLCIRDPQRFFKLLPGSRIAVMQMSTSGTQARQVLFGDIKARVDNSPWFRRYPYDPTYKNQIRFPKDIWIIPGDSAETTFEGYNILCGILDEIDSHKVTVHKDYAEQGYSTIFSRMTSRFGDKGFLFCVGQMKHEVGFAQRKYHEFQNEPDCYAVKLALWESLGWDKFLAPDGSRNSFWYDIKRKSIVERAEALLRGGEAEESLIEVPNAYRRDFDNNPEKALRDLAGIPPNVESAFISQIHKVDEARDRWVRQHGDIVPVDANQQFRRGLRAPNSIPRVAHIDIGISGDALGLAIGCITGQVNVDGEQKPEITIDLVVRVKNATGGEVQLYEVRRLLYTLRDEMGFNIKRVTCDSFQSSDMLQQLQRKRFKTDVLSVDKTVVPYYDLRDALYDGRLALPPHMAYVRRGEPAIDIVLKELSDLRDLGDKIDHPVGGSKDVADALAGVVSNLMTDRRLRRRVVGAESDWSSSWATGRPNDLPSVPQQNPIPHHAVRDRGRSSQVPWRPNLTPNRSRRHGV